MDDNSTITNSTRDSNHSKQLDLKVTILRGHKLPTSGWRNSGCYVKVTVDEASRQTEVMSTKTTLEWNKELPFVVTDSSVVKVELYHVRRVLNDKYVAGSEWTLAFLLAKTDITLPLFVLGVGGQKKYMCHVDLTVEKDVARNFESAADNDSPQQH